MTREQLQRYYPDTHAFFADAPSMHPFYRALEQIDFSDAKAGGTLLTDLEQMFSSLHQVDGHHVVADAIAQVRTEDELMETLTRLYVAYIYRHHGARIAGEDHGYDVEIEVADQLLALGVVRFKNFESLKEQFEHEIEDDIRQMTDDDADAKDTASEGEGSAFLDFLEKVAQQKGEHPEAHHSVLATITDFGRLWKQRALERLVKENPEEVQKRFPHVAGVVVIDPTPGKEHARFIPFHGDDDELELLLNRNQ